MDTPESVTKTANPFFLDYFQQMSEELSTLAGTTVVCTFSEATLLRGSDDLRPLFANDQGVAYATEDALNIGSLHLLFDTTIPIALAGMMMMTNEEVIQSKIQNREYDEETNEGFREVATQVITAANRHLEEKTASGAHLFLESAKHAGAGKLPATLETETTYLAARVGIKVAEFAEAPACWLFSRQVAAILLKTPIPGSDKEMAQAGASAPDEAFAMEEEEEEELPYTAPGELIAPQVAGSVRMLMTETPFTLREEETVTRAIAAITQDGYRYIGIERKGELIRVLSQSDIQQIMGPFYGNGTPIPRDKALYALAIGKFNTQQQLVKITSDGTINQAVDLMRRHSLYALPVVSNRGTLRGFVPIHAVLDYFRKALANRS
ncbi:MAG: CBS domain-containing protein [Magnetococcus sp. YQC-3]